MGDNPRQRPVRLPPANFAETNLPRKRQVARLWFRVHPSSFNAIYFTRLATHRYSHPDCPHKLLYLGIDPETCLWEVFGDRLFDGEHAMSKALWQNTSISSIEVPPLHLCDLSNTSTRSELSVDLSALMHDDLTVPQTWGLAIQKHPFNVPAIKFKSRFCGKSCLCIFDRAPVVKHLKENSLGPLPHFQPALEWLEQYKIQLV